MSNQSASSSNGNDRSRMYWTPLMERYFIDLMLEHLQKGNRVGHTFNKQAWTHMLTTFNAMFGSQYDKDVLKTRYTNLWKQFNDVKTLLSQFGFSWDAARQMVVANDLVWDAYVKSHPDVRCYRTKPVLNFDDLCMIYGYTVADGRYSLSSHDVSLHDHVLGDGIGSIAVSSNERPRTDWTASMDQFFIELLLDQLGRGNKMDSGFNKNAWTDMLTMFNAKFGCQHGKRVLKNRFKKLLKCYCDVTKLLRQGFLWNEQQQMLSADDDVWNAYVKAHPHAKTYRSRILPNYRDLELIFGNVSEDEISNLHQEKNHEDVMSETNAVEGKGNRNPSSTDRTRTYWTPPMDRCLIDLLLEQVKRGNRLGQTFITQAWNDMATSFNERFKSHYDEDVLKNRYKHLRKQFNDVDQLLRQGGFSWDDSREMVDAEDHVWDAYTKAHPEARSLRVKTLPGYCKLCVIFGEESPDTRYFRLSHNADPNSESPELITGEQKNGILPNVAGSTVEWTESMECCFVDLMIEQINRGNRIGSLFNEEAWTHMIKAFSTRQGLQCDKQFLMDRYFCLMKKHDDISSILGHSEFSWDENLQTIVAENEIWDAYIKDHPDAISYKNICLYVFHDLCKIFGNKVMRVSDARVNALEQFQLMEANDITIEMDMDGTSGNLIVISNVDISDQNTNKAREMDTDGSYGNLVVSGTNEISYQDQKRRSEIDMVAVGTSGNLDVTSNNEISNQDTERPREMDMDIKCGDSGVTCNTRTISQNKERPNKMDTNGTCGNLVMSGNTKTATHHVKRRPNTMPLDSRPPKKELRMKEALTEMASAVKALMNKKDRNTNTSFENALSALQAMPDIDEELVMDACDLLEDERKAKIFLALDISLRKKWLLRKLRQQKPHDSTVY
ncbi:uncharacterized protein LOC113865140 [Abrus precatorius]|uniref:Uncharacterized protein LOC113865140 n=1 Tax=Abrus precatorius TaxID=3816 RepID=A0A8B8LG33_ABRPR|nr:uncharacterized protein LOC113865140 [Abrus precatorius]